MFGSARTLHPGGILPALLLATLVLASRAGAQEPSGERLLGATVEVVQPIPVADLVMNTTLASLAARPDSCGSPEGIFTIDEDAESFTFREENAVATECAEIGAWITPPVGVERFLLEFETDRTIIRTDEERTGVATRALQQVIVKGESGERVLTTDVFPESSRSQPSQTVSRLLPLPPGGARANVSWYFEDVGFSPVVGLPGSASVDQFEVTVSRPRARFVEVPVVFGSAINESKREEGDEIVTTTLLAVVVPDEGTLAGRASLDVAIHPRAPFSHVLTPAGNALPADSIERTTTADRAIVHFPAETIAREGRGTYAFAFVARAPAPPPPPPPPPVTIYPIALAVAAAPLLPSALATRSAYVYRREAEGRYVATGRALAAAVVAGLAIYSLLALYVFLLARLPAMATLPLLPEGVLLLAAFALLALLFLALWIVPGRVALAAMRRDVAERKRQQEELERSNRELEHFAYVASHDLQEPLRTIAGFAQLLERRYADKVDERGKDYIRRTVSGSHRMQALINDLLAYSRVQTQGKPFERVDASAVLDGVLRDLDQAVRDASATITRDALPVVAADTTQLAQVFSNLLRNAIKYRHPSRAPRVHVSAAREEGAWRFSVADNGLGIDPQYHDRIFVIFQRLAPRDEKGGAGTGLGLAITKKIVERHGGEIRVDSKENEGATFHFTIPDRRL